MCPEGADIAIDHSIARFRVVVQSPSRVGLFTTPWTAAHQAPPSLTISWSLPKFMSIASVMTSTHFILWHSLILMPSIFSSIKVFFNESAAIIRWPKYWNFSFSISSSNELVFHIRRPKYWNFSFSISLSNKSSGLISFPTDWFGLLFLYSLGFFILLS